MALLALVWTLLSTITSLLILLGFLAKSLPQATNRRYNHAMETSLSQLGELQSLQVYLAMLDATLLIVLAPLFALYTQWGPDRDSIWHLALLTPASSFGTSVALLIRSAIIAALAFSLYLSTSHQRQNLTLPLLLAAAAFIAAISTTIAITCSQSHQSICVKSPSIKILVIITQFVSAILTTSAIIRFVKAQRLLRSHRVARSNTFRPTNVASRAPSLSLLIHTQSDSSQDRRFSLDLSKPEARHAEAETDFGPPGPQQSAVRYSPQMVREILGDTHGGSSQAATTSLGYASAVASSTNPYRVGSVASREALNGMPSRSRVDLIAGTAASQPEFQAFASETCSNLNDVRPPTRFSRIVSPALIQHHGGSPSSRALLPEQEHQLQAQSSDGLRAQVDSFKVAMVIRISIIATTWIPIVLTTIALLVPVHKLQASTLISSTCVPALILVIQELTFTFPQACPKENSPSSHRSRPHQIKRQDGDSRLDTRLERFASTSSSVVMIPNPNSALRDRRSHIRSFSCPLESDLNGYAKSSLGISSRNRQSLISSRSVPYLEKHWMAGKVKGDRVVSARSSFVRGLNLVLNPRPKLEILPVQTDSLQEQKYNDDGYRELNENRLRCSQIPEVVTRGIVQGLLQVRQGSNEGHVSVDSESTCITQSNPLTQDGQAFVATLSLHTSVQERANLSAHHTFSQNIISDERSSNFVLDMDETPGSPRLFNTVHVLGEHEELSSPTKGQNCHKSFRKPERSEASPSSFTRDDDSQILGSSTASKLFDEIMNMVKGNTHRMCDQQSLAQTWERCRSKDGYASLEGQIGADASVQGSTFVERDDGTLVIHTNESNRGVEIAAVQPSPFSQSSPAPLRDPDEFQEGPGLFRKNSTSSTFSISSISSRIRSLGRTSSSTPFGSPNSASPPQPVKKVRSRTFASAFGIELSLLNRSNSKGKRNTSGSLIESSPSTSAGTCPSSLLDLSFSPSPVPSNGVTSPGDSSKDALRRHKRNKSRADSIMDMLDGEERGDTIEEILDPNDDLGSPPRPDDALFADFKNMRGVCRSNEKSKQRQSELEGDKAQFEDMVEGEDLGDVTLSDAWERCFPKTDDAEEADGKALHEHQEDEQAEEEDDDLMGFDTRRVVAIAPFLDTVKEEPEDELDAELDQHGFSTSEEQAWDQSNEVQRSSQVGSLCRPEICSASVPSETNEDGNQDSRRYLLQLQEAKQLQVAQLLSEHETLFPHKTLSQILEVTELAILTRASEQRSNSAGSGSRLSRERVSSTVDSSAIHLGLPLSLACQKDVESSVAGGKENDDSTGSVSAAETEHRAGTESDYSDECEEAKQDKHLPLFVTPRSRTRCRIAAGRRTAKEIDAMQAKGSPIHPSPRSVSARMSQLGMDQGIWARSPLKLTLEPSIVADLAADGSYQLVEAPREEVNNRTARIRRSLTLTRNKLVRSDHHYGSPKRELRDHLARKKICKTPSYQSETIAHDASTQPSTGMLRSSADGQRHTPQDKRSLHKPVRKRRKSRIKGVAVMIARHQFTVVDEDDSLIQRHNKAAQIRPNTTVAKLQ
ncbi:uncharacterized protein MEPE_05619 [Melanopsichium pennsylvanicum]|uniref:Uncharacterized protein n=2 Tax=Melanopsichium pennsylvanicum TaxID=63383 RepID=A0AAJ5C7I1_9BASI|nr:hypothetical protein BN887_01003 [Melanopsichium pennsylvanicum 4]SNX86910.1 uncharacterized protein MEPE_05619 [Melanopsichium pennsylvanicum]